MKKLTVLGVGSAGCRITSKLREMPGAENLHLIGFDCDAEALKNSGLPEQDQLLAGVKWRQGHGCGGRVNEGKTAAAAERENLSRILADAGLLVVIAGLGRGFGSGAMSVIQSVSSKLHLPTVYLLTTPFIFEGPSRSRTAEQTLTGDLLPLAGAVVTVPNDLLLCSLDPDIDHEEAFALADRVMAESAMALALTLCSGNRLAADYDTLCALLGRKHTQCSIGHASIAADAPEKERILVEKLLDSPIMGGSSKLKQADAVLMILNGGEGLSLGNARAVFENAQKYLSPECEVLIGAGADASWGKEMQFVVLTVKFDRNAGGCADAGEILPAGSRKGRKRRNEIDDEFQPDLFSAQTSDLGVMEGTPPVSSDGANLDIPTFIRKNMPIDR